MPAPIYSQIASASSSIVISSNKNTTSFGTAVTSEGSAARHAFTRTVSAGSEGAAAGPPEANNDGDITISRKENSATSTAEILGECLQRADRQAMMDGFDYEKLLLSQQPKRTSTGRLSKAAPRYNTHTNFNPFARNHPKARPTEEYKLSEVEVGSGQHKDPIRMLIHPPGATNESGCEYCTDFTNCDCQYLTTLFASVYDSLSSKRITERRSSSSSSRVRKTSSSSSSAANVANVSIVDTSKMTNAAVHAATGTTGRHLCAKSLNTCFVARLIRLQQIQQGDLFVDLGCGNGSILFQVAYCTGAVCFGIELCPHNAEVARQAWAKLKPIFEKKTGRVMPHVEIITGDITDLVSHPQFYARSCKVTTMKDDGSSSEKIVPIPKRKILLSNKLFPQMLTQYIADQCRMLPSGCSILCFEDLYPHGRSVCRVRDPEAFELFSMKDYEWPEGSVEWTHHSGVFFIHTVK